MKIGIDLGTCFSHIAGIVEDSAPFPFALLEDLEKQKDIYDDNNQGIPTVFYNDSSNEKIKGNKAAKLMARNAQNGFKNIKKELLKFSQKADIIDEFNKKNVELGGTYFSKKEILCEFIKFLIELSKRDVKYGSNTSYASESNEIENITIAVPAIANDAYRSYIIGCVAEVAGIINDKVTYIDEPIAAALDYFQKKKGNIAEGHRVLVCDLGGATFDSAIVEYDSKKTEKYKIVLRQDGIEIGGNDWDEALENYILDEKTIDEYINSVEYFKRISDEKTRLNQTGNLKYAIREEIIGKKIKLSYTKYDDEMIDVSYRKFFKNPFGGEEKEIVIQKYISREEFEKITEKLCNKVTDNVEKLIKGYQKYCTGRGQNPKIDDVVLAGGSCKMPMIEKNIRKILDKRKILHKDIQIKPSSQSDKATAMGAAIYASEYKYNRIITVAPNDYTCFMWDDNIKYGKFVKIQPMIMKDQRMDEHDDGIYICDEKKFPINKDIIGGLNYRAYNNKLEIISPEEYFEKKDTITVEELGTGKHEILLKFKLVQGRPFDFSINLNTERKIH